MPNGEWELLDTKLVREKQIFPCCPEPYPSVTVTVRIRRKTLYYMYVTFTTLNPIPLNVSPY